MAARVYWPWFLLIQVVVERALEDCRCGLPGKQNAALVRLELAAHITTHHREAFGSASNAVGLFELSCDHGVTKPCISIVPIIVSFAMAVSLCVL